MILDRRQTLLNATAAIITLGTFSRSAVSATSAQEQFQVATQRKWHPMVQAVLDRSRNATVSEPDRAHIEDAIKRRAEATSYNIAPIKWVETPASAYAYLSHQGLEVLLKVDVTQFWRFSGHGLLQEGFDYPKSAHDAQSEATDIFRLDEREADVNAPKWNAKARALDSNVSMQEVFRVRAISSQVGWLETVIAHAAAHSIYQMELLLSLGASETDDEIERLLTVFEVLERGLLATWETTEELVCVPVTSAALLG